MTSSSLTPYADLMDEFAVTAMAQFIHNYGPEDMGNKEEMIQWCESIASASYVLAGAMMNTRVALHKTMIENFHNEEPNAD